MRTIHDQNLHNALTDLAATIDREISTGISSGIVQPEEQTYFKWKVEGFQYGDQGVSESRALGDYVAKKSWFRAHAKMAGAVKKTSEYNSALDALNGGSQSDPQAAIKLDRFVRKVVSLCLPGARPECNSSNLIVANFMKDLRGEPVKFGAKVELDGIVLQPVEVRVKVDDSDIQLRQTQIQDLEKEYIVLPMLGHDFSRPSAILNITFLDRSAIEIGTRIEQSIAILRLFKVGSVKYLSYETSSESVVHDLLGLVTHGRSQLALERSLIRNEDVEKLRKFWTTVARILPRSLYEPQAVTFDHLSIAYSRYCDALTQNGLMERKIANAVMGLEGLFLTEGETQELTYRLSIRVARVLGLLGYPAHDVRERIKDAYHVRSLFVHGGRLSHKATRKLERIYGQIKNLLMSVLDYLRASLVITVFLGQLGKEELVETIDASLIDGEQEKRLRSLVAPVAEYR